MMQVTAPPVYRVRLQWIRSNHQSMLSRSNCRSHQLLCRMLCFATENRHFLLRFVERQNGSCSQLHLSGSDVAFACIHFTGLFACLLPADCASLLLCRCVLQRVQSGQYLSIALFAPDTLVTCFCATWQGLLRAGFLLGRQMTEVRLVRKSASVRSRSSSRCPRVNLSR